MDLKSIISKLEELDRRHVTTGQETQTRMKFLETENETLKAEYETGAGVGVKKMVRTGSDGPAP